VDIARQSSYVAHPASHEFSLSSRALPPIAASLDAGLLLFASVAGEVGYQYCAANHFASLGNSQAV